MSTHPLIRFLLAGALSATAGAGRAEAQLAKDSPFLPRQATASVAGPTAGAPLELRGYIDLPGEGPKVRIYDPNRKIGAWLKVNERDPAYDFVVKQYDAARDTASVEYRGQTLVLAQREAKVTSSGAIQPIVSVAGVTTPMPATVTNAVAVNPTPTQERQIGAVMADVAQRRQAREQASTPLDRGAGVVPRAAQQYQPQPPAVPQGPSNGSGGARGPAGRRGQ